MLRKHETVKVRCIVSTDILAFWGNRRGRQENLKLLGQLTLCAQWKKNSEALFQTRWKVRQRLTSDLHMHTKAHVHHIHVCRYKHMRERNEERSYS